MMRNIWNINVLLALAGLSLSLLSCDWVQAQSRQDQQDDSVTTIEDIQRLGEANMDKATKSYVSGGADQEQTLRENTAAFMRLRFRPKALVDVSKINMATTILGHKISFPVGFSPSATHMISNPVGEYGTAKAARDAGTVMILSAMSSVTLEDVRASVPNALLWQHTYIFRNRSLTESIVKRASLHNYTAIVVTVDSPITGTTEGLRKNPIVLPADVGFANLEASWPSRTFNFDPSSKDFMGYLMSPFATWEDFRWLRSITKLPLVAKGILTAESALKAYENGASAILVSNHGGRQLDGDPATIEVLPEVVAAVGKLMEVYMDSGVRRGADVAKALSFGARAVFVGRAVPWGLAYNGKEGVDKVLEILRSEFNRTIQLLGVPDANNLCTSSVVREEYYSTTPLKLRTMTSRGRLG